MATASFIEHVFTQFQSPNWMNGVSIFNSGGISQVQSFGDMVSARCNAGIGEKYDVRLKLHNQGKFVQWMECTCQAYRRRSEKCGHIAALCLSLDVDHPQILRRMNLPVGGSENLMNIVDTTALTHTAPKKPTLRTVSESKTTMFEFDQSLHTSEVESIELVESEWTLILKIALAENRQVSYRLGVDDAYQALTELALPDKITQKIKYQTTQYLRRHFSLKKSGKDGIQIVRRLAIFDQNNIEIKTIDLSNLELPSVGRNACYLAKIGYIPFRDGLNPIQIVRWEEFPKSAVLEGDNAAFLVQSQFQRLRDTAELRIAPDLANTQVSEKMDIPNIRLKAMADGTLIVEPEFRTQTLTSAPGQMSAEAANETVGERNKSTEKLLLSIVKARAEGRQFLQTKTGWIKLSEGLDWLQNKIDESGKLRLTPLEFIRFREQFASDSEVSGEGDVVKRIRSGLISQSDLELPSLVGTGLSLRPYQEEGVKWLYWLYKNQLGGLLADEMGLGKTHQAMALLAIIAQQEPGQTSLVVCPTSVIDHWIDKCHQFIANVDVIAFHGSNRKSEWIKPAKKHKVIITSYGILLREFANFAKNSQRVVVLDEAHLVKNQTTRTYRAACKIPAHMRLCLTGTPLENDLMELKNLFDFIAPQYLGTDVAFKKRYISNIEKDPLAEKELQRLIHPLKMRRNKKDVLKDLPAKVEDIRYCHLNRFQHQLYSEALALKGQALIDVVQSGNAPIPYIHIFSIIALLKQICDDPGLIDPKYNDVGSGKLNVFDELLDEALDSGQKVVVFSQYAKMINRLSDRLKQKSIQHVKLTGASVNRGAIVREFQENPGCKVFLGSLLAGGTGIDLTAGSMVIHFDRWWNAAKEDQATDRIHRIGQERNVQVYKLVTKGTLEEKIDEIISRKKILFDRFIEQDNEVFKNLSREELLRLLAPPEEYLENDDDLLPLEKEVNAE